MLKAESRAAADGLMAALLGAGARPPPVGLAQPDGPLR